MRHLTLKQFAVMGIQAMPKTLWGLRKSSDGSLIHARANGNFTAFSRQINVGALRYSHAGPIANGYFQGAVYDNYFHGVLEAPAGGNTTPSIALPAQSDKRYCVMSITLGFGGAVAGLEYCDIRLRVNGVIIFRCFADAESFNGFTYNIKRPYIISDLNETLTYEMQAGFPNNPFICASGLMIS